MRLLTILPVLALLFATSCEKADANPDGIEFRVRNVSSLDFDAISANGVSFGSLTAGNVAPYVFIDGTYRYGFVRTIIDGDTSIIQPIDFVGETFFTDGKFTFEIGVVEDREPPFNLEINFVED